MKVINAKKLFVSLAFVLAFAAASAFALFAPSLNTAGADADPFDDFAVTADGISITQSMDSALYVGVKAGETLIAQDHAWAVTEFILDDFVFDETNLSNSGLLIQINNPNSAFFFARVMVLLNDTTPGTAGVDRWHIGATQPAGGGQELPAGTAPQRFVPQGGGTAAEVHLRRDRQAGSRPAQSGRIPANSFGTWNIPWSTATHAKGANISGPVTSMRVMILLDVSSTTSGVAGRGVEIGMIATYNRAGSDWTVVPGISTPDLNSTTEINLANIATGTRVRNTHRWLGIVGVDGWADDTVEQTTIALIEYDRVTTKRVNLNYRTTTGTQLLEPGFARVSYTPSGFTYTITPPNFDAHEFVAARAGTLISGAEVELTGPLASLPGYATNEIVITLWYAPDFEDYFVKTDSGAFVGIGIDRCYEGAFRMGIREDAELISGNNNYNRAVTEFMLDNFVFNRDNGGLLIQLNAEEFDRPFNARVMVFINDELNRFFAATQVPSTVPAAPHVHTHTLIQDGDNNNAMDIVVNRSQQQAVIPAGASGTWNIPWTAMTDNTNAYNINSMRVVILLDVDAGTAADTQGLGIVIGMIATYARTGNNASVIPGMSTPGLTYTFDPDNDTADVNLADISKGTRIYSRRHWLGGLSIGNYNRVESLDPGQTVTGLIEFGRVTNKTVTVNHVDAGDGFVISPATYAVITFTQNGFAYAVTPLTMGGFEFNNVLNGIPLTGLLSALAGYGTNEMSITLRYDSTSPRLVINFVDGQGNTIRDPQAAEVFEKGGVYNYSISITAPEFEFIGNRIFVSADKPLSGTIAENTTIILTYGIYDNFDVIVRQGNFYGVGINDCMEGAFYMGLEDDNDLPDGVNWAVTEFNLGHFVLDHNCSCANAGGGNNCSCAGGGLLVQLSTVGFSELRLRLNIFVNNSFTNSGSTNKFYSAVTGIAATRDDVFILDDGTVEFVRVTRSGTNFFATIPGNTVGTWNIRWADIFNNMDANERANIHSMRVAIWKDVAHATAFYNLGNGVSIGTIATYARSGNNVTNAIPGIMTPRLSCTYDPENTTADINMTDITKGRRIFNRHLWNNGPGIAEYLPDTERATIDLIEYARTSALRIPVNYILVEQGKLDEILAPRGFAQVMYREAGLTYTVAAVDFFGHTFVESNLPLTGVIDLSGDVENMVFNLQYERTRLIITFVFRDADGNEFRDRMITNVRFNDFVELQPPVLSGWTFVQSSRSLNVTVMNNVTIILTYHHTGGGCGGGEVMGVLAVISVLLGSLLFLKKRG